VTDRVEREVKLDAGARYVLPDLGADGELVVEPLAPRLLDATYYDSADLRLLGQGITVRRRTGEGTRWTVKFPTEELAAAGGLSRREVDLATDALDPPAGVVDLVSSSLEGAELVAVARLVSRRARFRLAARDGRPVAEIDDDRVTVFAPGAEVEAGEFREIEVEFGADADDSAVVAVVDRLLVTGAARAGATSKVGRALDLLGHRR